MLDKLQLVANYVQNVHEHDGDLYDACPHGPLEGHERHKKSLLLKHNFKSKCVEWICFNLIGTKLAERFSDLVLSTQIKKNVPKLSPGAQTASLEGFHAVVNHFAPNMIGLSYHGMLSR